MVLIQTKEQKLNSNQLQRVIDFCLSVIKDKKNKQEFFPKTQEKKK